MVKKENLVNLIDVLTQDGLNSAFEFVSDLLGQSKSEANKVTPDSNVLLDETGFLFFEYGIKRSVGFSENDVIQLNYKGRIVDVKITPETIFPKKYFCKGEEICIVALVSKTDCRAKAFVTKEFYEMFKNFESYDKKLVAMNKYLAAPLEVQSSIKAQLSGKRYSAVNFSSKTFTSSGLLRFRFDTCRDVYTPQQQMDIETIFEECTTLTSTNKTRAEKRLTYFLNINQSYAEDIAMTKEEIIKGLDMYLYKHDKIKEKLAEAVVASKYSNRKGFCILLIGNPGVGKTAIMKALANVLGIPFFVIPLGSSTSMLDVVGDAPQFDASDCGEVVKAFYKAGTTRIVMGLDEYDKSYESSKEGGKVIKAFNDAISEERYFKDAFLGTYINTENTIFIATANSTDTIPENLLNRFTVINVDDYTEDDKVQIGQNYILPSILKECGVEEHEIVFPDFTIKHIAQNYCEDDGARDLKKNIESVVKRVLSVWDSKGERSRVVVSMSMIDSILENFVDADSPMIAYRRNKELYSEKISEEIKDLVSKLKRENLDGELREKYEKKLKYLVQLIPVGNAFSEFDKDYFYAQVNATHYGLESVKKEVAQIFYVSALNNRPLTSNRILLVGPPGIGKTSIVKSIAKGCKAKYSKVSLNGISDEKSIKGHSLSYVGADAGSIIKAIYKMKTTKGIVHLDEIDKMGSNEGVTVANTLVDLLDDSAEFTDNFIVEPIDLSGIMFIATANDISAIDKVLLDRFTVIQLEGYTEREKAEIVSEYIIPKAISELCPDGFNMEFSEKAHEMICSVYCRSFGVRDADKAVRQLVRNKLYTSSSKALIITSDDVKNVLGAPPSARGNFPSINYPGLSKALAVTGNNCGMAFSVETMLIPDESSFTVTGLPKESTLDSVKLAVSYIKCNYPGMLNCKGIHVHFGEGAVQKDGPSAGVAILMSVLSATFGTTITENVAYTGEINANGYVFNIGGTIAKIQAAEQSGCSRVFIPQGNYSELDKEVIKQFNIEIVPVVHVSEVIKAVLPHIESNVKIA